ncbi:MAG: pitrilysin family protein [Planctomycetota bacterium]
MTHPSLHNTVGEDVRFRLAAGSLPVILNPRPGFTRTFVVIGTNFGSVDQSFVDPLSGTCIEVPSGVAHFLEHRLFEDSEGDVSDRFTENGASSNARTGFTSTAYLFSCTSNLASNLELLLDFVQEPYFAPEGIAREQGIIEQEIRMYEDDPDWRIFFNLLNALYHVHPVRSDIAGTVDSIHRITPEILEACYRAFYHPSNMALAIAGAFDVEETLALVESNLARHARATGRPHVRPLHPEPDTVRSPEVSQSMVVSRPKIAIGFKEVATGGNGEDLERRDLLSHLAIDLALGRSSAHHEALYSEGLIDESFAASYTLEPGFGFSSISSDTNDPERLRRRVLDILRSVAEEGFSTDSFERLRRRCEGQYIRMFDALDSSAFAFLDSRFRGVSPFAALELLRGITLEEVEQRFREHFHPDRAAVSMVLPK